LSALVQRMMMKIMIVTLKLSGENGEKTALKIKNCNQNHLSYMINKLLSSTVSFQCFFMQTKR
jgi:hypothetical protein